MKRCFLLQAVWILVLLAGCSSQKKEVNVMKSVKTDTVRIYGDSPRVTFPGKIRAASDMNLAFRVSGPILRMHVDVGSYVRKGQLLAEIDPRDYEVQLAATKAEYQQIKNEAARITELYEKQSIAPNDYDKALYGLQQISAKYNAHKNALADTKLLAPCEGYIQKRLFQPSETVSAGLPILSMISNANAEVEINIPSSEYIRRDRFESYYCSVDIFPDKSFPLHLIGITHKANMNQLYTMRFRLVGEEKNMPGAGMSTMVTIQYKPEGSQRVSVPLSSIFESDKGSTVWVYNQSTETVSSCPVNVSQILIDGTAVISMGLREGDIVISAGVHSLKEGEKVKLLPATSPTNVGGML